MTPQKKSSRPLIQNGLLSIIGSLPDGVGQRYSRKKCLLGLRELKMALLALPPVANMDRMHVISSDPSKNSPDPCWVAMCNEKSNGTDNDSPSIVYALDMKNMGFTVSVQNCFTIDDIYLDFSGVRKGPKKNKVDIRTDIKELLSRGFHLKMHSKVDDEREGEKKYTALIKFYPFDAIPDERDILLDLKDMLHSIETRSRHIQLKRKRSMVQNYTVEDLMKDTGLPHIKVMQLKQELKRKKNIIFQGPPGTGKTYIAERLAWNLIEGTKGKMKLVQFHPSYTYEDFVQGFKPKLKNKMLSYELEDGSFKKFCQQAQKNQTEPYVMLIDEINRANISRVFGELMHLLEYRDKEITLEASGERFRIPENVYIIGTMNTADRSIAIVDYALRRRFTFINLFPDYGVLERHLSRYDLPFRSLIDVLKDINGEISDPNYFLGISYFMRDGKRLKEELSDIWRGEIEPYLEEYFYDNPEKAKMYRYESLVKGHLKDWV